MAETNEEDGGSLFGEIKERFCAEQTHSGISFPSNRISCVYVRVSFCLTCNSVSQSPFTHGRKSQISQLSNNTFFPQTVCATPSLLPLWSLLDAAVFYYSQQTLGLHVWPDHSEHTARVQLATQFPLLNRLISSFYHNRNSSSQTSSISADTFSSSCRNVFALLQQINLTDVLEYTTQLFFLSLLSSLMVLFLNITRDFLRTFSLPKLQENIFMEQQHKYSQWLSLLGHFNQAFIPFLLLSFTSFLFIFHTLGDTFNDIIH